MPRLPTLKTIPLEGDLVSREVRLLAVQGRRYSPALDAFVKVVRLRDWSVEPLTGACKGGEGARITTTRTPAANRFQPIDPQSERSPPMPNQTDKTLARIRTELLTTFTAADWSCPHNHLVGWLPRYRPGIACVEGRRRCAGLPPAGRGRPSPLLRTAAPQRTLRPEFLPGGGVHSAPLNCCALQAAKDEFESVSATLAVVTPETRNFPRQLKQSLGLDLKVLSDVDYRVAMSHGVLFRVPDETKAALIRTRLRLRRPAPLTGLDVAHSRDLRDRRRRPNPQRVRRARLHDPEPAQILASLRQATAAT